MEVEGLSFDSMGVAMLEIEHTPGDIGYYSFLEYLSKYCSWKDLNLQAYKQQCPELVFNFAKESIQPFTRKLQKKMFTPFPMVCAMDVSYTYHGLHEV